MGIFGRKSPQLSSSTSTGWATTYVSDLYSRRWIENDVATPKVERDGKEVTDPVPPGLRLLEDAGAARRFFAQPPARRDPATGAAAEYVESKIAWTSHNLSFDLKPEQRYWVNRFIYTVFKVDGLMMLDAFNAHGDLQAAHSTLVDTTAEDDAVTLVAWWMALSADDPYGGSSMWIHMTMDKAIRLGFEEAGAPPRREP